jgi:hypothetical protein
LIDATVDGVANGTGIRPLLTQPFFNVCHGVPEHLALRAILQPQGPSVAPAQCPPVAPSSSSQRAHLRRDIANHEGQQVHQICSALRFSRIGPPGAAGFNQVTATILRGGSSLSFAISVNVFVVVMLRSSLLR